MNRAKVQQEIVELFKVAESAPNLVTDAVLVREAADKISEINNKKILQQTTKPVVQPAKELDVAAIVSNAVKAAIEAQEGKMAAVLKSKELEIKQAVAAKESELQSKVEHYEKSLEELRRTNLEQIAQQQSLLSEKEKQVAEAKEQEKRIASLFKLHGSANPAVKEMKMPGVNTLLSSSRERLEGTIAVLEELRNQSPAFTKSSRSGAFYTTQNFVGVDNFVRQNREQVIKDLETHARKNGLLLGPNGATEKIIKQAATQISDIPGGFLQTLSSIIRTTHRPGLVFWQFAQTEFNYLRGEGSTVEVYRSAYQTPGTVSSDWLLSGGGSFSVVSTNVAQVQTGIVPIVLQEWGMGATSNNYNQPVALSSFVMLYSMINLVAVLERNLGQNYAQHEEIQIRSLYNGTSVVLYNNQSNVVSSPSGVLASLTSNCGNTDSGTITKEFLTNLHSYIYALQVEPFPDGNFALVLCPQAVSQLKNSLLYIWRIITPTDIEAVSNILNPTVIPPESGSRVSGYLGTYYGFHIFESNAFGVGSSGQAGVQTETINSVSTTTRTSYAFGNSAVGRGVGTPMEIRQNEITNYQRLNTYIWRSEEGFAALDVDPVGYSDSSAVPQQLRVFQIHTTDKPV
jgi:hypothetical protein